jgi:hypothetical protein
LATEDRLPEADQLQIPSEVKNAAALGKLAFFVGNGISRLYDLPSWDQLCSRMLHGLATRKLIDHNRISLLEKQNLKARISIADYYFKGLKNEEKKGLTYKEMLLHGLDGPYQNKVTAYASLAKCGVKFVTTNYDDLLEQALRNKDKVSEVVKSSDLPGTPTNVSKVDKASEKTVEVFIDPYKFSTAESLANNLVFHLHGSFNDENTIVASTADYLKLYSDSNVRRFLRWFFKNHVVIFIGYGLEELELLDLIIRSGQSDAERKLPFFLLLPMLSDEADVLDQLRIYYDQLKITLLAFSRDKKDYSAYADLLEIWSGELAKVVQSPTRIDDVDLLNSYIDEFEGREDEI